MIVGCRGICTKYKTGKVGSRRFVPGVRWCKTCDVYMKYEGHWCPCCGTKLRTKPRSAKCRKKYNAMMGVQIA